MEANNITIEMLKNDIASTSDKQQSFPIDGFKPELKAIIENCAKTFGTNKDYWAASMFSAIALAIGNKRQLETKYVNSPLFWMALVGNSGSGKTEPLRFSFAPFHKTDAEAIESAKDIPEDAPPPIIKQYILSDTTPEAIIRANQNNTDGIIILRDELSGFFRDFGRYNRSGEVQNYLSAWSQQPMTVNRKSEAITKINNPFCAITGGIQPGILPEMAKDGRDVNGFLARFCFVYPESTDKPNYTKGKLDNQLKDYYTRFIHSLIDMKPIEAPLKLSNEAEAMYKSFYNKNAEKVNNESSEYFKAIYNKLDVICLRIALTLEVMKEQNSFSISAENMQSAIDITEYFRANALKAAKQISAPIQISNKDVIKFLNAKGASQNEIAQAIKCSQPYVNKILKKGRL